jgi:hypothetical protein
MWYLNTMEFYSPTKNEILSFTSKWMELENNILSEVSQAQQTKNLMYVLPHIQIIYLKQCSNIFGHALHTKRRTHTGGIGKGKET